MQLDEIQLGDAYKLIKEIPDKSIDLIYTDIPYQMNYSGGGSLKRKSCEAKGKVLNELKTTILDGIDYSILGEWCRVLKKIYCYIWCSKSQIYDLMKYFIQEKNCNMNILAWCKTNPVPFGASPFLSDMEYCLCFYESGAEFNQGYEHKRKWYSSAINKADNDDYGHPTIKPIEFVKSHLLNSTKEGDIVLDPFMGSGTTAAACKELGRHFIGFEINPKFHEIAIARVNGVKHISKDENGKIVSEQLSLF